MSKRGKISIGGLGEEAETAAQTTPSDAAKPDLVAETGEDRPSSVSAADRATRRRRPSSTVAEEASSATVEEGRSAADAPYEAPSRRPRHERKNAFDISAWLIEGVLGVAEELRHNDLGLPEEFWVHASAARKETLLAARALIDTAIERCDEDEAAAAKRETARRQRGPVNINFD